MRLHPALTAALAGLLLTAGLARPAGPAQPSPLRLIPAEADAVLDVADARQLSDVIGKLELLAQVQKLAFVKEQLDSTNVRRGRQLLAYFEKQLGAKWPELLDKLGGGGAAVGLRYGNNAPAVLVVQGTDEKLAQRFLDETAAILEGELARQESKDKLEKGDYHGVPGFKIGSGFWVARAGSAIVVANKKEAMAAALNLHLNKGGKSVATHAGVLEAHRLLPKGALARAWFNLKPAHESPQGKALYQSPRDNAILTVPFGSYLDVLGRSPWVAAAVVRQKDGFLFTIRAPRGREGMGSDRLLHLPPDGQPVSKPLLEPRGVLYSSSFYLDVASIWKDREKHFPKQQADTLTKADQSSGRALGGVKLSTLLESVGARHRLVVVNQPKAGYTKKPQTAVPAFAFVADLRDADRFARTMDTLLSTAALAASTQFKMELAETKHKGVDVVAYRFDEKAELKQDTTDIRFNFSPCFARVGKSFIFCSTIELCKELIDILQAEEKSPGKGTAGYSRDRVYAAGLADLLASQEDALITQTILDQAVPPAEAREQVRALIELVRGLGTVTASIHYDARSFRYEFRTGK